MAWCEAEGCRLPVRPGAQRAPEAVLRPRPGEAARLCRTTGKAARAVQGFRLPDRDLLEPTAAGCGQAEHLPDGANPRFVVTSLGQGKDRRPRPLRRSLLRPRRDGKPHQGMPARPVRRPHVVGDHAGQPTAPVVRVDGLRAAQRVAAGSRSATPSLPMPTCGTIRLKLLKIGALVRRSVRRIKFGQGLGLSLADRVRTRLPLSATRLPAIAEPDRPRRFKRRRRATFPHAPRLRP